MSEENQTPSDEKSERRRLRCGYCHKLNTVFEATETIANKAAENKPAKKAPACRRCRLPLNQRSHQKWSQVDADAYIHPLDRQALKALRAIPGVDLIIRKLVGLTIERMHRVLSKASAVRVSKDQYAHLDQKLEVVCQTLNLAKPELYVSLTDQFGGMSVNAFTTGVENPFIVLYAGLVEQLSEEELLAVIAHEMGHIHCQHLLYRTAATALLTLMETALGKTPVGAILRTIGLPIQIALITWMHKSELSCDRTALLVVQDARVVMTALTKLAGGNLKGELNLDAFIEQAREFDRNYQDDFLDKFWTLLLAAQSSHPFPVWRISEILKWSEDTSPRGYQALSQQGEQIRMPDTSSV